MELVRESALAAADGYGAIEGIHRAIKHERDYKINTNVIVHCDSITFVKLTNPELPTLADRLKFARKRKDWSQQELADAAGISQGAIGNLESGQRQQPRDLLAISSALGISAVWLELNEGPMLAENAQLRGDVLDLARLMEQRLTDDQVAKIREMVLSFAEGGSSDGTQRRQ